jgi:hypothetical protein
MAAAWAVVVALAAIDHPCKESLLVVALRLRPY